MIRRSSAAGFTLIELMLAMAFISVLLLSIAMVTIQGGRLYARGATLRSVNQAGRDISEVLRRDFLQTNSQKISQLATQPVIRIQEAGQERSGRFCLGQYSYVWNTPQALQAVGPSAAVVYAADGVTPIVFARVYDENGALCQPSLTTGTYPNILTDAVTTHLLGGDAAREVGLALHDMRLTQVTKDPDLRREGLFRLQFTIGTSKLSEINTGDASCKPPDDQMANTEFCAINNFDMIVRANG